MVERSALEPVGREGGPHLKGPRPSPQSGRERCPRHWQERAENIHLYSPTCGIIVIIYIVLTMHTVLIKFQLSHGQYIDHRHAYIPPTANLP